MVKYDYKDFQDYILVTVTVDGDHWDILSQWQDDVPYFWDQHKGLVLTGDAPNWLFAALSHYYNMMAWVAVDSPSGPIVVYSRNQDPKMLPGYPLDPVKA